MYNRTYIAEKLDKAIKSLQFLRGSLDSAPEWMHVESEDDPLIAEMRYTRKQLDIITDHMEARDRAAANEAEVA